jgi:hypothetical protein
VHERAGRPRPRDLERTAASRLARLVAERHAWQGLRQSDASRRANDMSSEAAGEQIRAIGRRTSE